MKIDVKKIAKLANLPLTDEEEEKLGEQLSQTLDYIDQLNKVDTSTMEPTYNVSGLSGVIREDETAECLNQEDAILNTKKKKNGYFVTKGIFDDE